MPVVRDVDATSSDCDDCPIATDRRRFFRDAALALAGTLVALGATRRVALALPVELIHPGRRTDHTVTYPVPTADGAQIDRDNQVIIVRWQNVGYAFNLSCPHQNTALRWDDADRRFQCPKHHSKYQPDGTFISGRATRSMDRLGIRLESTSLIVDLDQFYRQDKEPEQWKSAFVTLTA
ncbi:MAG TPA: Rieske 2Fe-2S domain-containing protein [Gemmatimonadaceae bacterium]|jgi:nitrite reductase/ring-hydroxylating ferredoxin subunit